MTQICGVYNLVVKADVNKNLPENLLRYKENMYIEHYGEVLGIVMNLWV